MELEKHTHTHTHTPLVNELYNVKTIGHTFVLS